MIIPMPGHPPIVVPAARATAILYARRWLEEYADAERAELENLCGVASVVIEFLLIDVAGEDVGALVARINAKYDNPPEPAV
jgi:hypothetical protein